uniref:Uncharacterized protein n=1 Tax=Timema genevievae TaxID=629358 RepID=A0A7R9JSJ9_TIMGE|nr:unnamed protein product [Timema genevievae]
MNTSSLAGKVIRAPSLKRGKNGEASLGEKVKLERVLGLTVSSNAALDCDPDTELVVYPAGCTVVLFNPIKNRQSHLLNISRKTITCLALSPDGHYLVTGECGHLPLVRVWDLHEEGSPGVQVAEFPSHKYGINCVGLVTRTTKQQARYKEVGVELLIAWYQSVQGLPGALSLRGYKSDIAFSPSNKYVVSVGSQHDMIIKEAVPLMGRSAILGEQRNNYFCDVACGHGKTGDSTYAITKSGLLCEFNNRRLLDKWVELRTTSANCIALGENFIFIGCAEGIVRCFTPSTLQFVTTLPRTHYLGVDVAQGLSISHMAVHPTNAKYPDAVALAYDPQNCKLTCIYNDHSMYIWDVRDIKRVGKSYSFLFHSACIWGVDMYPVLEDNTTSAMPHGCFITCSSDDTIRVWNLDPSLPLPSCPSLSLVANPYFQLSSSEHQMGGASNHLELLPSNFFPCR